MASIISIKLAEPTKAHPFKFFDAFFIPGALEKIRDNFFKVLEPNEDEMSSSPYLYIAYKDKDSFEIEYSDTRYEVIDNYLMATGNETRVKVFHFRNELIEYLRSEYYKAAGLLDQHMSDDRKKANNNRFFENEVKKIIQHLEFIKQDKFYQKYSDECQRPLNAIVKNINKNYLSFVPRPDKVIANILSDEKGYPLDFTPDNLKISLANDLSLFSDKDDELIFFKQSDKLDLGTIQEQLRNFISGQFSEIKNPINFTKNIEAVYYLIFQIVKISRFTLVDIEAQQIITLNGRPFKADNCSKGKGSFISKNATLRKQIDLLLKLHAG